MKRILLLFALMISISINAEDLYYNITHIASFRNGQWSEWTSESGFVQIYGILLSIETTTQNKSSWVEESYYDHNNDYIVKGTFENDGTAEVRFHNESGEMQMYVKSNQGYYVYRLTENNTISIGSSNGHEYVDLGLPSGTLWATCNIGAMSPEQYGNYYAWGETNTKSTYSLNTYKYYNSNYDMITKYWTDSSYGRMDNKTTLETCDDVVAYSWGGKWRIPSRADWFELINYCTWTWTSINGRSGYKVSCLTNKNNYIFLPAAGYRNESGLQYSGTGGLVFLT